MATYVVTGANKGIGYSLCKKLIEDGDTVFGTVRNDYDNLEKLGVNVIKKVDVTKESSVKLLKEKLRNIKVDVLINNAGIGKDDRIEKLNINNVISQFEVNTIGPLRVTCGLLNNFQPGSKIVIISSRLGSIGRNSNGKYYGYRISKAGVNMAGVTLARDLYNNGIIVVLVHPGYVKTDMTQGNGDIEPDESAEKIINIIKKAKIEDSGKFISVSGDEIEW